MSEPAHEPNASTGASTRTPNARSTSPSTSGTASNSVDSNTNRLRRTSSSTRGRARRTSSVCHQIVRISRTSSSTARRRARPVRGSSSRSSSSHQVRLVVEHGAPRGLGRVRGEHELDVQRAQRLGGVDARLREQLARSRPATRAAGRRRRRTRAGAGSARAPRRCWRAAAAASRRGCTGRPPRRAAPRSARQQRLARRSVAAAQLGGGLVQPAHRLGDRGPVLLDEDLVEHLREQARCRAPDRRRRGRRRRSSWRGTAEECATGRAEAPWPGCRRNPARIGPAIGFGARCRSVRRWDVAVRDRRCRQPPAARSARASAATAASIPAAGMRP